MPFNLLHRAALEGSAKNTERLLSTSLVDVNECTEDGFTPLNVAAQEGHIGVARVLLHHNASVTVSTENGCTPLILSAQNGHIAVTKLLIDAGSELDATTNDGITALHQAADGGHSVILSMLVSAGANPNTRASDGSSPMYDASFHGHLDIVKKLLLLNVHPAFPRAQSDGPTRVALDVAAQKGYSEVIHALIQHRGIAACGGESGGVCALQLAAKHQHVDTMRILKDAGVVDTGDALFQAIQAGRELSVKFLVQQKWATRGGAYLNSRNDFCCTPLFVAVAVAHPRIVRLLLDAGADETLNRPVSYSFSGSMVHETLLAFATRNMAQEIHQGQRASEEELIRLKAIHRLLVQVDAVRAVAWLWNADLACTGRTAQEADGNGSAKKPTVGLVVRILRNKTRRRRALLATVFRYAAKP